MLLLACNGSTALMPASPFAARMHPHRFSGMAAPAEISGGILAGITAGPLYGVGAIWLKKVLPWSHPHERPEGNSGKMVIDKDAAHNSSDDNNKNANRKAARCLPGLFQQRTASRMVADQQRDAAGNQVRS